MSLGPSGHDPEGLEKIRQSLDALADQIEVQLKARGIPLRASLLWQPWNLLMGTIGPTVWCAFSPLTGGTPTITYTELQPSTPLPNPYDKSQVAPGLTACITDELHWNPPLIFRLPMPQDGDQQQMAIAVLALEYAEMLEKEVTLSGLDLTGFEQLEPLMRDFLEDHPSPERNVFIIMPFRQTPQLEEVHETIVETLRQRTVNAIRADSRRYSDDLWTNIQVYMHGCRYGIAVFEQIDDRDYNPNVALEVGYMLALRKRVLLLKEKRQPRMQSDIAGKMYRPWDSYDIRSTIGIEVAQWADSDLRL